VKATDIATRTAICLMGPTATGKTQVAIELCRRFPLDVISVDSALVYRGMDIGTAKPDAATLRATPHRLVDIRDPEDSYSAGDFVRDARQAMQAIFASGRTPLLVGGTMMYFRALTAGMAELPPADSGVRAAIDAEAAQRGWPALHDELRRVDAAAAARINPNDSQRIQRALEVYRLSGRPLSAWQEDTPASGELAFEKLALQVEPRALLHQRIAKRLERMLDAGFTDELRRLMQRPGLHRDSPAMRAVGYRQFWAHLAGECTFEEAKSRALAATRQLAKRQITWLRSESGVRTFDALDSGVADVISGVLEVR
jgi:tRNA dimethylallyltransferase